MPSRLGSPNKNKQFLFNRLQDMYENDFHPIMKMAENAITLHELASKTNSVNDLSRSIDAWDRIAKYTEPKLRALDCYPEEDRVVNVIVKRFDSATG
jgi:hypothetical protein